MVYGSLKATVSSTSQEELIASRDAALDKAEEDDALDVEVQDITSEDLKEDTEASSGAGSTGAAGTETTGTESKEQSKETEDGMTVIDENTRVISISATGTSTRAYVWTTNTRVWLISAQLTSTTVSR